ncbi:MAG: prepilin-type N-terminal cleavage/methylation domain-containing protein [Candidatus Rokubacteria bacterium]|nr:prepilin-type N-terminal cleavage/methylation domain-containing protein [Candidatus Rokubacteria bacterium]
MRRVVPQAGDQRGISLIELLVASSIFALVAAALGMLYLSVGRAYDTGSGQAYIQRLGSLIEQDLSRQISAASEVSVRVEERCGPADAASWIRFISPVPGQPDTRRCVFVYQDAAAGDSFDQLYLCTLGAGSECQGGTATNLLRRGPKDSTAALGASLRVLYACFTQIVSVWTPPPPIGSPCPKETPLCPFGSPNCTPLSTELRAVRIHLQLDDGLVRQDLGFSVFARNS